MHEECFKRIWHISRTSHFYSMNLQTSSHFWFLYFLLVFKECFWRTEAHHFDDDLGSLPDQLVRDERGGEAEHGVSEGGPEHAGGGDRLGCLVTSVHQHPGHSLARRPENCITGWVRCNLCKACTNSNTSTDWYAMWCWVFMKLREIIARFIPSHHRISLTDQLLYTFQSSQNLNKAANRAWG